MPGSRINPTTVRVIVDVAMRYFGDDSLGVQEVCRRLRDPNTRLAIVCATADRKGFFQDVTPLMVAAVFAAIPTALSSAFTLQGETRKMPPANPTLQQVKDLLETGTPEMRARWRVQLVHSAIELHEQYRGESRQKRGRVRRETDETAEAVAAHRGYHCGCGQYPCPHNDLE